MDAGNINKQLLQLSATFTSKLEIISPDIATEYLKRNTANRPLSRQRSAEYADIMKRGAWVVNGEGIAFGTSGRLLNGQNRLHAVIISNLPVIMQVTRGIIDEDQAFNSIDSGMVRSNAQRMQIVGVKRANEVAAAIRWLYRYKHGVMTAKAQRKISGDLMMAMLRRYSGIEHWVGPGNMISREAGGRPSLLSFLLFATEQGCGRDIADEMFYYLRSGEQMGPCDPLYLLRQRLIAERGKKSTRMKEEIQLALAIKAANAFSGNREMRILRFESREEYPEFDKFPMEVGTWEFS